MRIFILSTSMGMGGADQQILILARAMRARGHDVRVVALTPLGPMGLEAQREGIPTESLELRRNAGDLPRIARLVRMIREWRPDILHTHMVHANLLGRAVRPLAPVGALVSTIHSISDGGRLRMAGYRLTNGLVDRVTIISRLAADRYVKIGAVPAGRLEVIPNTVDLEQIQAFGGGPRHNPQGAGDRKRVPLARRRSLSAGERLSDDGRRVRETRSRLEFTADSGRAGPAAR